MRAHQVRIQRRATASREYDAITVVIGDLHLRCDAVDDRSIRLARRLADAHGATFMYDDATAERVRSALQDHGMDHDRKTTTQMYEDALQQIAELPHAPDAYIVARACLNAAAAACLENHANGNFKHDTREECAEAISQIAIK